MVFDMGGGTLDVSLAEVEPLDGHLQVRIRSRSRYTELAGTEFDLLLAAYVVQRLMADGLNIPENPADRRDIFRSALFDLAEPLKTKMSSELERHFNWGPFLRDGPPFDDLSQVGRLLVPREREVDTSEGPVELPDMYVPFDHFNQVLKPFFVPEDPDNPQGTGTIYGPIHTALEKAELSKEDIDVVLMHGGMCWLPLIQAALMHHFPKSTLVTASPDPMTSVAQGAALYHAREKQASVIEVQEPALFESIFYEHEGGFELVVGKDRRVGQHGVVDLPISRGTRRVRLQLYQGFDKEDPLLTHDRDMRIELPVTTAEERMVKLRWEIMPTRTVVFAWQDPEVNDDWQPLQELSTARQDTWYPDDVRRAEGESIDRIRLQ